MKYLHRCALVGLFLGVAPLAADGPWTPPVFLDPGTVLELTPSAGTQTGNTIFIGALFDEAANSLELGRVNVSTLPPTATFVPIETGSIFALGGIDQAAGFVGFSYINPAFDLKFARCAPPCNSVPAVTIDSATNWIDSSSAASADDFFVAGIDDGSDSIKIHYSDDGGATWHLLNTLTPPNLYVNFNGGKRIALVVDPAATNPATTSNCLLYDTRPTAGTTTLRLNCRNGASPVFDVAVDSDIPNPLNQFDRFIETSIARRSAGAGTRRHIAASKRATQQVRGMVIDENGLHVSSPIDYGPVPTGTGFYSLSQAETEAPQPKNRVFFRSASAPQLRDIEFDPDAPPPMARIGPTLETGPLSMFNWSETGDPADAFLFAFAMASLGGLGPETPSVTGFAVSWRAVGLFDDSFETQNLSRWSASAP